MMIIDIEESNYSKALEFLKSVPTISNIDEEVLKNGLLIIDEDIKGIISFEVFEKYGLIRYFVFKKSVLMEEIDELFLLLIKKAKEKNLESIITIASNPELKNLFISLNFVEVDRKYFFIEENSISNTKYKETNVLIHDIGID